MRTRLVIKAAAALCISLALMGTAAAGAQNAAVAQLHRFFRDVHTFHAHFHQVLRDDSGSTMQDSAGEFTLQRPGRFRWVYQQPYKQVIVSDGTTLWTYDKDLAQVTERPVSAAIKGTPAQLLSGGEGLDQAFTVQGEGRSKGLQWVQLTPKSQQSDFKSVKLGFRDGHLHAMVLHDSLGETSHITFSDVQVNPHVASGTFHFQVPKGVDVVH